MEISHKPTEEFGVDMAIIPIFPVEISSLSFLFPRLECAGSSIGRVAGRYPHQILQ